MGALAFNMGMLQRDRAMHSGASRALPVLSQQSLSPGAICPFKRLPSSPQLASLSPCLHFSQSSPLRAVAFTGFGHFISDCLSKRFTLFDKFFLFSQSSLLSLGALIILSFVYHIVAKLNYCICNQRQRFLVETLPETSSPWLAFETICIIVHLSEKTL